MKTKTALILYGIGGAVAVWGFYNELVLKMAFFGLLTFSIVLGLTGS